MARRTIEVIECDVCGSPDGIVSYSITSPVGTSEVELCSTHRTALDEAFQAGLVRKRPGRRPKSNGATATQAASKKAPAKKPASKSSAKKSTGKAAGRKSASTAASA